MQSSWRKTPIRAIDCSMNMRGCTTFLASLRRDRGLFALVGSFLIILAMMQPLAAAIAQGDKGGHWVICTLAGAQIQTETGELPGSMTQTCPACVLGNGCGIAAPAYRAILSAEPAFPAPDRLGATPLPDQRPLWVARPGPGNPPTAIRAPPFIA